MSPTVLLVTDRPVFEETWRPALQQAGLSVRRIGTGELGVSISESSAMVLDGGSEFFDEDELLAGVGLARALKVNVAVALPANGELGGIEDVMEDMCSGLIARELRDTVRVAGALARRCDPERGKRFEYLTVSPRADELLAVLGDGKAVLVPRPVGDGDDGATVTSISISEDASSALLVLEGGKEITIRAAAVARSHEAAANQLSALDAQGDLGGPRLGARLRHLRLAAGLTQAELARRTGIHRPNIARVEAGRHTPSLETLSRLASAIGVSAAQVLAEK